MDGSSDGYRTDQAPRLLPQPLYPQPGEIARSRAREQGPGDTAWSRPRARDLSRLDRLYRLKLAGRDPERRKRRRRSLHELACWLAVATLLAAALASPVRAATGAGPADDARSQAFDRTSDGRIDRHRD